MVTEIHSKKFDQVWIDEFMAIFGHDYVGNMKLWVLVKNTKDILYLFYLLLISLFESGNKFVGERWNKIRGEQFKFYIWHPGQFYFLSWEKTWTRK